VERLAVVEGRKRKEKERDNGGSYRLRVNVQRILTSIIDVVEIDRLAFELIYQHVVRGYEKLPQFWTLF
jgi:hypothetical protein